MCVLVTEGRGDNRRRALNKQRGVDICNFRHTLVSDSHRAHSPYKGKVGSMKRVVSDDVKCVVGGR
jgi:hypothetical protein